MTVQDALVRSAEELRERLEKHQRLLARAGRDSTGKVMMQACLLLDCPHRRKLKETLVHSIGILEETRKAFKSKRLEKLRKGLFRTLAECE